MVVRYAGMIGYHMTVGIVNVWCCNFEYAMPYIIISFVFKTRRTYQTTTIYSMDSRFHLVRTRVRCVY
jgi:hypothetical protein